MKACRRFRGAMAASVYGELNARERDAFDRHQASCAACRTEAQALAKLRSAIPDTAPELDRDLLPGVRRRLAEQMAPRRRAVWRLALATAACGLIAAAIGYTLYVTPVQDATPTLAANTPSRPVEVASVLQATLDETMQLIENRDFTGAVQMLAKGVEAHPDAPAAGEAQKLLADITFEDLQWYPEAYAAYEKLVEKYPAVFTDSPESILRRNVLAEARDNDFEALYKIDAAQRGGRDAFARLEKVVCDYPGGFIASRAAKEMAQLALGDDASPAGETKPLYAMALARDRCTQPVASVQLTLEMGLICWEQLSDPGRARDLFNEAVNNEHIVLAQRELAQHSLRSLPTP